MTAPSVSTFSLIEGLASMRIEGEWCLCNDGAARPAVRTRVPGIDGALHRHVFLVDSCADRTVLSPDLLEIRGLPTTPAPEGMFLEGITGECAFVLVRTVIELTCNGGGLANLCGEFATFTDPSATDLSILGRDIPNHFDVTLSRRCNDVFLLACNHQYRVDLV
jgi:hypothetical protein